MLRQHCCHIGLLFYGPQVDHVLAGVEDIVLVDPHQALHPPGGRDLATILITLCAWNTRSGLNFWIDFIRRKVMRSGFSSDIKKKHTLNLQVSKDANDAPTKNTFLE